MKFLSRHWSCAESDQLAGLRWMLGSQFLFSTPLGVAWHEGINYAARIIPLCVPYSGVVIE
jgi:hypothetical protein